ncbi:DEAD-box ATP-dependent RNA helicase 22 [Babesia sp. Xinjiang]|uniref:DEAD-box ATP-dependent RNA helicase 22 n=1 Tax=Babesia sp. Xinjiang TaxID=462227 RepID=UPI000A24E839|nr:DEAD-box ATP-dependent RNA helicase 22 [Babesia sp. Xinjiang]ORM40161.1 DEAD-box ATP-dependent RNA helicase 22 [Babesia sp. Xinjiang]
MAPRVPLSVYGRLSSTSFGSRPLIEGFRRRRAALGSAVNRDSVKETNEVTIRVAEPRSRVKLHPLLRLALLRSRGISQLNDVQESSFMSILSGKDVTIHAPIGSGKTLAYLLPIVNNIYNIHDLLEDLQLRSGDLASRRGEDTIRRNALGYSRRVPHALLPRSMSDLCQDSAELASSATKALESHSTTEKLVDTLYKVDPRHLKRLSKGLPLISRSLWGRRSRNSIFRALLTNPLGSVRCCVIVVPNKDLVSQVISEISAIDPLGRLSVQTLAQVHRIPPPTTDAESPNPSMVYDDQPFYPTPHTLHYLASGPQKIHLSLEDEREMVQRIPTVNVSESTVETVPVNMGPQHGRVMRVRTAAALSVPPETYAVDGLLPRSIEFMRRPVMTHPVIQYVIFVVVISFFRYGSCDIVVTTPKMFLNDLLSSHRQGVVPACVVFDEADTLFENNASRSAMMELCSMLRPRPRTYHPLLQRRRPRPRALPPCQFIHVASTLNYGGMQTAGSMLYERFTTSSVVSTSLNHYLASCKMRFLSVESAFESKLRQLMETLIDNPFPKTMIFVDNLAGVREVSTLLRDRDWPVLSFHSRSSLATRLAMLDTYRSEEIAILVCTDLITRGINIPADHIINFSFPRDAATFVHRVKGKPSLITNFVEPGNQALASELYRAYISHRPVNRLLSRKRSFGKRQSLVVSGEEGSHNKPRNSISRVESTSDTVSHVDRDENTTRNTIDRLGIESIGGVKYRRRSAKSRGIEFYNNFNAFS